jgi:hypothetical protein
MAKKSSTREETTDERAYRLQRERLIAAGRPPVIATRSAWEEASGATFHLDTYDETGETDPQDPEEGEDEQGEQADEEEKAEMMGHLGEGERITAAGRVVPAPPLEPSLKERRAAAKAAEKGIQEGPKGGRYYISPTGQKIYVKDNPGPEVVGQMKGQVFVGGLPMSCHLAEPSRRRGR